MFKILVLLLFLPNLLFADDVRLITWNVYMLPWPIKSSHQKERTQEIAGYFANSDYDLIFLQEAFTDDFVENLENKLKNKFPYIIRMQKKKSLFTFFSPGLVALSKFPMKEIASLYYEKCTGPDCFASKGVDLVEITLPTQKKIQIANTHMQAGRSDKVHDIRTSQLEEIKNVLARNRKELVPQLLVGDLNVDALEGDEFEKALGILGMRTVARDEIFRDALKMNAEKVSFRERFRNFITAGFPVPCIKDDPSPTLKFLDHVFYHDPMKTIRFADDEVLNPEFKLSDKSCPMSDHKPRAVKFSF